VKNNIFISFEGPNAVGKSTQIKLLKEYLENFNRKVIVVREPGGTKIGEELRSLVKYVRGEDAASPITELMMFSASRAQLIDKVITPHLVMGYDVIVDRFADSTTAYQGYGRGLDLDLIHSAHDMAVRKFWPGVTFMLDLTAEESIKRCVARNEQDRFEDEDIQFFEKVRNGFLTIAKENSERCVVIDASKSIDDIHVNIVYHLRQKSVCK